MPKTIMIGRSSSNSFILDDPYASKQHAQILLTESRQVYIIDLDSTSGTTVNGGLIPPRVPYMLREYDIVRAADTLIPWKDFIAIEGLQVSPQDDIEGNLNTTIIKDKEDGKKSMKSFFSKIFNNLSKSFKLLLL